jgi:hypothetical protein
MADGDTLQIVDGHQIFAPGPTFDSQDEQVTIAADSGLLVESPTTPGDLAVLRPSQITARSDSSVIQALNNAGAQFCALTSFGILISAVHAAPDSDYLGPGDLVLWFDQSNGAAKLMVKAKTANGTVVTGSVNLA